jgi:hypothetical protein
MGEILLAPLHLAILPRCSRIRLATALIGAAHLATTARLTPRRRCNAVGRRCLTTLLTTLLLPSLAFALTLALGPLALLLALPWLLTPTLILA